MGVARAVDGSHAAAPNFALDFVPPCQPFTQPAELFGHSCSGKRTCTWVWDAGRAAGVYVASRQRSLQRCRAPRRTIGLERRGLGIERLGRYDWWEVSCVTTALHREDAD